VDVDVAVRIVVGVILYVIITIIVMGNVNVINNGMVKKDFIFHNFLLFSFFLLIFLFLFLFSSSSSHPLILSSSHPLILSSSFSLTFFHNSVLHIFVSGDTPPSPYAYTFYRQTNQYAGASWFNRCINIGVTNTTQFYVQAASKSTCTTCDCNLAGYTSHSYTATHYQSWNGYNDVIGMSITGGAGSGESYYYAKGLGWVGFNGVPATQCGGSGQPACPSSAKPNQNCNHFSLANICPWVTNNPCN
jgi:hypothetical protein